MRQRRIKDLDDKLAVYAGSQPVNPRAMKGHWQDLFDRPQPLYLELGCGKGQFIRSLAAARPERNFLAVEGNGSVLLRALQRTVRRQLAPDAEESDRRLAEGFFGREGQRPAIEEVLPEGIFAVDLDKAGVNAAARYDSLWRSAEADCLFAAGPNLAYAYTYIRSMDDVFEPGELAGIYLNFSDPWPKDRYASRRLTHRRYLEGYRRALAPGACLEFKTDNEALFRFSVEEFAACQLRQLEYTEDLHGPDVPYESAGFMTEYEEKFSSRGNPIYYCKVQY